MAQAALILQKWNGPQVIRALGAQQRARMTQAVEVVSTAVKKSMKGGGSPHTASLPGQPPAIDTGLYRSRIHTRVSFKGGQIVGFVVSPSKQARALELGYAPGGLAPRPHLRPALQSNRVKIYRILVGSGRVGPASLAEIKGVGSIGRGLV